MKGSEFLRKLQRIAKESGLEYRWNAAHGKGSHGTVHVGSHSTTVKDLKKEIGAGLLRSMCRSLEIDPNKL